MPTHAILITWDNMLPKVLVRFKAKAQAKYGAEYHELIFGDNLVSDLSDLITSIPNDDPLRIYISGHGGTGIDYITDDSQLIRKTVDELVDLLTDGLSQRPTSKDNSAHTKVIMISCLFGRTPNGQAMVSPAAKLHDGLADWDVFVDLVARTESMATGPAGHLQTISLMNHKIYERGDGRRRKLFVPRQQYTKVLYSFNGDARVSSIASYDAADTYVETTTLEGRRLLWADHATNRIVDFIKVKNSGILGKGPPTVSDSRQRKLKYTLEWYESFRQPPMLKAKLEALVPVNDFTGPSDENFTTHRNIFRKNGSSVPKTAQFVRSILSDYPLV